MFGTSSPSVPAHCTVFGALSATARTCPSLPPRHASPWPVIVGSKGRGGRVQAWAWLRDLMGRLVAEAVGEEMQGISGDLYTGVVMPRGRPTY